jgi:hypothetical protein
MAKTWDQEETSCFILNYQNVPVLRQIAPVTGSMGLGTRPGKSYRVIL